MSQQSKREHPSPSDLKWLVKSRTQNQEACADLYELITSGRCADKTLEYEAKTLVSIGFSLWRAAFLADKSGKLEETNKHTTYFLAEMLKTNAIAFTQDKKAEGFTFNYYLANVRFRLTEYKNDNCDFEVEGRLLKKGKLGKMSPKERWRAYQKAFKDAVKHFKARLAQAGALSFIR